MIERLDITPDSLMDDHNTQIAAERLEDWEDAMRSNSLYLIWACGDSREELPFTRAVHVNSLTAGGPRSPYSPILKDRRIMAVVIALHHDGDLVVPGKSPGGCGGREAKESVANGNILTLGAVGQYIDRHVWSSDLVIQAFTAGAFTALRSGKDTLTGSVDHLDLTYHPLATFTDHGEDVRSKTPLHFIIADKYFPEQIYKNGLPELSPEKIPPIFKVYLQETVELSKSLNSRHHDLREIQKTQNPAIAVLSTDVRPFRVRYPYTAATPGSIFRLSVPQLTIEGKTLIKPEDLHTSLEEMDYPINHFSNLHTVLIETRNMDKSKNVAQTLAEQLWMQGWLRDPQNQVLVAEVNRGKTQHIERFK